MLQNKSSARTVSLPGNVPVRAEGCSHVLPCLRELDSSEPGKNQKLILTPQPPLPRKKSWLRVVRRALERGRTRHRGRWIHVRQIPLA